jgi:hypothetical protein
MGAIYVDPAINRATIDRDECVECYACYNGMSKEQLNPTLIRAIRGLFKLMRLRFEPEPDVCPTSALEPEEPVWPRINDLIETCREALANKSGWPSPARFRIPAVLKLSLVFSRIAPSLLILLRQN